ncbi:MAG: hypothetical protein A3G34_16125 [Candidatus Lindowbacteria bacterium RIFCSPLOWO2_12_FULL_62_27]|nr:MAG: hypothetical protein A3I06_12330 [Candidatus Lindowbacteria bacterium RIFCSPLOWO2_02_FULL_62_12]OGH61151.1 MAG: hypothetical protein A3G34_16125 [Candidatus Lindowbacteria bacterium RIFCSPLOWO2_12_FULL_62_27]
MKKKLPDFSKMTDPEIVEWFDAHDMTDYFDESDIVEIDFEEKGDTMLQVRLPKSLKRQLDREARRRGLRGASTCVRAIVTEVLKAA